MFQASFQIAKGAPLIFPEFHTVLNTIFGLSVVPVYFAQKVFFPVSLLLRKRSAKAFELNRHPYYKLSSPHHELVIPSKDVKVATFCQLDARNKCDSTIPDCYFKF